MGREKFSLPPLQARIWDVGIRQRLGQGPSDLKSPNAASGLRLYPNRSLGQQNFSRQFLMSPWPTHKICKVRWGGPPGPRQSQRSGAQGSPYENFSEQGAFAFAENRVPQLPRSASALEPGPGLDRSLRWLILLINNKLVTEARKSVKLGLERRRNPGPRSRADSAG
jgi:hypothetical protein